MLGQVLQHGRVRRASLGIEGATTPHPTPCARAFPALNRNRRTVLKTIKEGPAKPQASSPAILLIAIDYAPVLA